MASTPNSDSLLVSVRLVKFGVDINSRKSWVPADVGPTNPPSLQS